MKWSAAVAAATLGGLVIMANSCGTTTFSGTRLVAMERSPQYRDGRFHNDLARHDGGIWDMLGKAMRSTDHAVPEAHVFAMARDAGDYLGTPDEDLRVTWLGHSTVLVEIDGHRVLTDPVWSKRVTPVPGIGPKRFFLPPLPIEELPPLDAVVISHDHYDHLDRKTIEALKERAPRFVVPLGVGAYLEDWGVDPARIVELDWWEETPVGALTLTATPARHFSGRKITSFYQDHTLWAGWSIAGPRHRVYYSGDTAMFPGFTEIGDRLGPFDLTLMEVGAYDELWPDVHMGPEQAVEAHRMVRGGLMLPVHWGTFNLANHSWTEPAERVLAAAGAAGVSVTLPRPGQIVDAAAPPALARWWPDIDWKTAAEAPVVSTGLDSDAASPHDLAQEVALP